MISDLISILQKVNVKKVLKDYAHAHVLFHALIMMVLQGTSKKSLEIVRESVTNKIVKKLRRRYKPIISDFKNKNAKIHKVQHEHSNYVWVCWLQGMDKAPRIVRKCYHSLLNNLGDRKIILLTNDNYKDWVTFPTHIQEKIDNGLITNTHMTDFLRLELLEHYGGTWIDATVFCSGNNIPSYIWDSDLFIYQCMKPGLDGHARRISSWFITSCTNHPIIMLTKELLYAYWGENNHMVDYFLIHDLFELAIEAYPKEWEKVIPISNSIPHILLLRFADSYDEKLWKATKAMTPFHKLSYKFTKDQMDKFCQTGTFYNTIFEQNNLLR